MQTGYSTLAAPSDLLALLRARHSTRAPFDPAHPLPEPVLVDLLEAARWAPTAHNMQNFEIEVVDDAAVLAQLGAIEAPISGAFIRENYQQLSFSRDELIRKRVGLLADWFPPGLRKAGANPETLHALGTPLLRDTIRGAPTVLVVTFDPRQRAPASEGDVLGMMSLGCLLQNLWLAAEAHHVGLHVMSTFATSPVAAEVRRILAIPDPRAIAFALGLGYPTAPHEPELRVRRDLETFVHRNRRR